MLDERDVFKNYYTSRSYINIAWTLIEKKRFHVTKKIKQKKISNVNEM